MNIINRRALKGSLPCHVAACTCASKSSSEVENQDGSLFPADSSETVSEH